MKRAFTLIELLIVVAIIAILAAIAVPNFLEAQMRAKIARCRADMRTLRIGFECYAIDNNNRYPPDRNGLPGFGGYDDSATYICLTTPVAYLSAILKDPFVPKGYYQPSFIYGASIRPGPGVFGLREGWPIAMRAVGLKYWVLTAGPNLKYELAKLQGWGDGIPWIELDAGVGYLWVLYDPSNGTVSDGDIIVTNKRVMN